MEDFSMPRFYRDAVDLFTADEHAVLSEWFYVRPPKVAKNIEPEEAMARLGFQKYPNHYLLIDAVVAFHRSGKGREAAACLVRRASGWQLCLRSNLSR